MTVKTFPAFAFFFCLFLSAVALGQNRSSRGATTKTFVLGIIDEIQSEALMEKRILNIYLPEGYNKNPGLSTLASEYLKK